MIMILLLLLLLIIIIIVICKNGTCPCWVYIVDDHILGLGKAATPGLDPPPFELP